MTVCNFGFLIILHQFQLPVNKVKILITSQVRRRLTTVGRLLPSEAVNSQLQTSPFLHHRKKLIAHIYLLSNNLAQRFKYSLILLSLLIVQWN